MADRIYHVNSLQPVTLEEIDSVSLMRRVDTKFVVPAYLINELLDKIKTDYKVLQINAKRLMKYNSIYFDTETFTYYNDHHNQRKNRVKIRIREYLDTKVKFIEIKRKTNKGMTSKMRKKMTDSDDIEGTKSYAMQQLNQKEDIKEIISNSFERITLVNKELKERVTIDTNIHFNNVLWSENLAIIELKQERLRRSSPIFKVLKSLHINPSKISKYCLGMSNAYPELKTNNFKQIFKNIQNIIA